MNENQNNLQYYKDEVNLKELVMVLWKRKKMIISFTLIIAVMAAVFSMFVITPVYDTILNIVISMPETYSTRYGEYKLPLTNNEQYVNLIVSNDVLINTINDMGYSIKDVSVEDLKEKVSIEKIEVKAGTTQNSFDVKVSADNPEESLKLAQTVYSNYLDFIDAMTKERVVSYYNNYFKVELRTLANELDQIKETLRKNEELLAQTPQFIPAGKANIEIQTQLDNTSDYVIPVDNINPNYIKIENNIVENKQKINSIENSIRIYNKYLEEIEVEKQAINRYYRTGEAERLESSIISVVETSVYLPSPPVAPTQKTSPSNALNTVVGAILGGMFGVLTALIKEYWFKETN